MLQVIQSNKLDVLAGQLAKAVHEALPQLGLFDSVDVLVQSPAHAAWLKALIAEHNGICANVRFPMMASWFWQLHLALVEHPPSPVSPYHKSAMAWLLYQELEALDGNAIALPFDNELLQKNDASSQRRRFHFCEKVADVFDQYLVYRPDWISAWEQGDSTRVTNSAHEPWQAQMWRLLIARVKKLGANDLNRIQMGQQLLDAIENSKPPLALKKPVFVFGLSSIPPQQLQILQAISRITTISFYQFNPSQAFWTDIIDAKTFSAKALQVEYDTSIGTNAKQTPLADLHYDIGHPLLASWGKQGRDYLGPLLATADVQDDCFIAPSKHHLLARIQRSLLNLDESDLNERIDKDFDDNAIDTSIQIHGCHSELREVEVLYDFILAQLDSKPHLEASDFIVMAPNIQAYSSAIRAVFRPRGQGYDLPIHVVDPQVLQNQAFYTVFFLLLGLNNARLTHSDWEALMHSPVIISAFQLTDSDREKIQNYLFKSRFHWGLDGNHKKAFHLPTNDRHTLSHALQRLMLGYTVDSDDVFNDTTASIRGLDSDDADSLDKLYRILDYLTLTLDFVSQAHDLHTWQDFIRNHIFYLLAPEHNHEHDMSIALLRDTLEQLDHINTLSHWQSSSTSVSALVIADYFRHHLNDINPSRLLSGGLNFTNLLSARGIPHKVVCLLGMNDGDFPVHLPASSFDLMAADRARLGDRLRRDDDQYLFLEALCAAEDIFYLSYQALSKTDNQVRFPSKLVQELKEYCELKFQRETTTEVHSKTPSVVYQKTHKLQPFSGSYQDGAHPSYQHTWSLDSTNSNHKPSLPYIAWSTLTEPASKSSPVIELDSFIRFFMNPARYYLEQIHGIFFQNFKPVPEDKEPFELGALQAHQIRSALVEQAIHHHFDEAAFTQAILANGMLTNDQVGLYQLERLVQATQPLLERLKAWGFRRDQNRTVRYLGSNLYIVGFLNQLSTHGFLQYSASGISGKLLLSAWIQHLMAQHSGHHEATVIVSSDPKGVKLIPLEGEQSGHYLSILLKLYQQGTDSCLLFPAQSAHEFYKANVQGRDPKKAFQETWLGNAFKRGEATDPYWRYCAATITQQLEAVDSLAEQVFGPLYQHLETI